MLLHAQRKHVIHSLDTLLQELHILSFILSPGLLIYLCRALAQFTISRPRDIHSQRKLGAWFLVIIFFNIGALWTHSIYGADNGPSVVLDFVGIAHKPSRFLLLSLDVIIILLQFILTFIAFENGSGSTPPLQPDNLIPHTSHDTPLATLGVDITNTRKPFMDNESAYIIDVSFGNILTRLRSPPPQEQSDERRLPFPITTPLQVPSALRMVLRARAQRQAREEQDQLRRAREDQRRNPDANPSRRLPGSLGTSDDS